MSKLPYVSTGVEINRVEVWITNKTANFDQSRNVVAFLDLGETDKIKNTVWTVKTPGLPSNKANSLYEDVVALDGLRDIDKFNSVMQVAYPESSTDVVGGEDYEKLESARRLNDNEFIVNKQLGYISLRSQLNADEGTGKGGAHEIILILGAGLDGGEDVILHKLTGQVQHVQLGGAGLDGLCLQPCQRVGLAHVAGDGDDLGIIVVFLQPGDDDGRIQTAGIGENDLLDVFLMDHSGFLLFCESVVFIHDGMIIQINV